MTDKIKKQPEPQEIDETKLDEVSGGAIYAKYDTVTGAPPDPVRTTSIIGGTK